MRDHQIERPTGKHDLAHVTDDVRAGAFTWQQVNRNGIVTARNERVTNDARELARDQDAHFAASRSLGSTQSSHTWRVNP
jgi:hypothetical protein